MPKRFKWLGLGLIVLLLAACSSGQSLAGQYPVTPTNTLTSPTLTPPQRTMEPTITPTFTNTPVSGKFAGLSLYYTEVSTQIIYDQGLGWPVSIGMPKGTIYYAYSCGGKDVVDDFYPVPQVKKIVEFLRQPCGGKSALMVIYARGQLYNVEFPADKFQPLKVETISKNGQYIDYFEFTSHSGDLVLSYAP